MFVWQAHEGAVTSLAFAPGAGLLSAGVDGNVRFWDPAAGAIHHAWKFSEQVEKPEGSNALRVLADGAGTHAAIALRNEGVQFIRLADGTIAGNFPLSEVLGMAPASDGTSVFVVGRGQGRASGRRPASIGTWVYQHAYPPGELIASSKAVVDSGSLAVSPDGRQLRAGGVRFTWPDGARREPIIIHSGGNQLAVSWDNDKLFGIDGTRVLVSGFWMGTVHRRLKGHAAAITGLTATPDGRKIWTASADATVRQWDVDSYHCEKCYSLKIGPLGCVAVSPDGLTAAAGSALRGSIAIWDLE